jgi:hypothetical protein
MADIVIVIERKRHDKDHWIRPGGEQQYRVYFAGEDIGSWRYPEHAAARWLLEHGRAQRSDTLRTRRLIDGEETPSMRGSVGWFADHTVNEKGTPRIVKWVAMPEGAKTRRGVD